MRLPLFCCFRQPEKCCTFVAGLLYNKSVIHPPPKKKRKDVFMRLRKKPLQRTAAALALSMAVSVAATPATAAYKCDISKGSVSIKVDKNGNKEIKVNGETVTNDYGAVAQVPNKKTRVI